MLLSELIKNSNFHVVSFDRQSHDPEISALTCDSRKAGEHSLFVCISGANTDGHLYADVAYDQGCRAFVCEKKLSLPSDAAIIRAEDSRIALAAISAEFYGNPAQKLTLIGVTGTKGKTTTSVLILQLLAADGKSVGYIGSNGIYYNGTVFHTVNTTPESCELHACLAKMLECGIKYVVMEVSSQGLYLNRVYGIDFEVCVYTNLSRDHIGGFGEHPSFDHYRECKHSLFTDHNCVCAVYNADDDNASYMLNGCSALLRSYGVKEGCDFRGSDIKLFRAENRFGIDFVCHNLGKSYPITMFMPGDFNAHNALAAIAVGRYYGVPFDKITVVLSKAMVKGRLEVVQALPYATFIIDYAHNQLSLSSVLDTLRKYSPTRLICVFGSVGGRTIMRRSELGAVAAKMCDLCIVTSDNPDKEPPDEIIDDIVRPIEKAGCPYVRFADRRDAIVYAIENARPGDIILFAGKGHEDYQLIMGRREPFSERDIILETARRLPAIPSGNKK